MLALLFYLGESMYTISCEKVREIVPMMRLKPAPNAPKFFTGFFNFRGRIVPVIDLRELIQGRPCEEKLSTRIILVDFETEDGGSHTLGLMAEKVTETIRRPEDRLLPPTFSMEKSPYLEGVQVENDQMIHHLNVDAIHHHIGFLPAVNGERADD